MTPKIKHVVIGGERYYSDDVTRDQVPGVTSILAGRAKPALINWAAKSAAEFAVSNLETITTLAKNDSFAAVDLIKRSHSRTSGTAAGKGTEVHSIVERLLNGETGVRVSSDLMPFIRQFQNFANEYQLKAQHNEITVWSDKHRYAGTIDGIWKLSGPKANGLAICDIKTGASGVWEDAALQLTAYRNADFLVFPDGSRQVMPEVEQTFALWLRPEGYALLPLDTGPETFAAFLALRKLFEWNKVRSSSVVRPPVNTNPLRRTKR